MMVVDDGDDDRSGRSPSAVAPEITSPIDAQSQTPQDAGRVGLVDSGTVILSMLAHRQRFSVINAEYLSCCRMHGIVASAGRW